MLVPAPLTCPRRTSLCPKYHCMSLLLAEDLECMWGGVPDLVTEETVRAHFTQWGCVSDVYFPGAKGQKRLNYCFVTFDNQRNAERACNESARNLDGWVSFGLHVYFVAQHLSPTQWVLLRILLFTPGRTKAHRLSLLFNSQPLESISMAEDRKDDFHHVSLAPVSAPLSPAKPPSMLQAPSGLDAAQLPGYIACLQLQYQQQVAAVVASASAPAHSSPLSHQATAQPSPQAPFTPAGPHPGLDCAYLQANVNSPFSNQQWMESLMPQPISQARQMRSAQHLPYLGQPPPPWAEPYGGLGNSVPGHSTEYLTSLAQQSRLNAAGDSLSRQALAEYTMKLAQSGGM